MATSTNLSGNVRDNNQCLVWLWFAAVTYANLIKRSMDDSENRFSANSLVSCMLYLVSLLVRCTHDAPNRTGYSRVRYYKVIFSYMCTS